MKTLIARWNDFDPENMGPPDSIRWADGTPATFADFRQQLDNTHHEFDISPRCYEMHFYPEIVADVRYDPKGGHWVVTGKGVETTALFLADPFVGDDQIIAEMCTLPTYYRHRIHRPAGSP